MFLSFLYELRRRKVPVGPHEALTLAAAMERGLHENSLDGFYHVARALLIHSEAHLDSFDEAFLSYFKGIETEGLKIREELLDWLRQARQDGRTFTDDELALLEDLDPEELWRLFERTMREQDGPHSGGNRWIGTGGTSPFGHGGAPRAGIRVGGPGGNRSAIKVADARLYQPYRSDLKLDVRQMSVALRKLRSFAREGGEEELDLEETIDATARNAGELEIVVRPPRRSNTRVILLMDVGGSMDPHARLVSRLFTAASKATHFKEFRSYYFHNCVYGYVYETERLRDPIPLHRLFSECRRYYKLIVAGDAWMAPYELLQPRWVLPAESEEPGSGLASLVRLAEHFQRSVWLNPEPEKYWQGTTIERIRGVFQMFPLTLQGLEQAVAHLTRGLTAQHVRR